jgi:glycosyltransferase involved in cell wall biosynthesis
MRFDPKQLQTVWFDVTDVFEFINYRSSATGIQRVVSMLVLALDSLNEPTTAESNQNNSGASGGEKTDRRIDTFAFCRYDFGSEGYVTVDGAIFRKALKEFLYGTSRRPRRRTFKVSHNLKIYVQHPVSLFASFVVKSSFRQQIPDMAILLGSRILDRLLERRGKSFGNLLREEGTPCPFKPGDTFVFLGAFWFKPSFIYIIIGNCRAYKLRLFLGVLDLIPARFPAWFPPNYGDTWSRLVEVGLRSADCVISISRYGERDLLTFCREHQISPPRTAVLRLGDEITVDRNVAMPTMEQRVTRYLKPGFVLMVSSIDVRKNQELLIRVWERLYRKHGTTTPYLILIGKPGTDYSRVMKAMRQANFVNGRIIILHDVGDSELSVFYQHAMFTMLPSFAEGWGLPVAESMAQGKLCIASNATSIPEIAGPLAEYFDPDDADHCYQLVERYAFDAALRSSAEARIKEQYRPMTWAATARSLAEIIESTCS